MRSQHGDTNGHKPTNPHLAGVIHQPDEFLIDAGVHAERNGALRSAVNLFQQASFSNLLYNLAKFNYKAERLADALPLAKAAELLTPQSEEVVHLVGSILMDLNRDKDAIEVLDRATRLNPPCAYAWYDLGVTFARINQRKKARRCFEKSLRLNPTNHWTYYTLACLDALDRKRDKAFVNLALAIRHGFCHSTWLRRDADLQSLHSDPRWKVVVRGVGLNQVNQPERPAIQPV